ncbi:hypothetical protein HBI56_096120 [Parastagonospora nodorum]|nr:hypothetical protein HBH53_216220 [Parastagonospora nodorum]KAH3957680.1 hypothetical protein HBH51_221020 [Parastagonospora nodorum]KAH3989323.1 hypothetical protein HBH52_017180 [Parastagonospora nodorum]KAH3998206.1 hypothetical protein HBI10_130060 [Parastagonospora nodorum]KAH4030150.1 hypothetical protein HBI13_037530 [Parastagonospora nodorum]
MCYYRYFKFQGCGHTTYSSTPVRYCENAKNTDPTETQPTCGPPKDMVTKTTDVVLDLEAGSHPKRNSQLPPPPLETDLAAKRTIMPASRNSNLQPCEVGLTHPLYTRKIETQCGECIRARDERLYALESMPEAHIIKRMQNRQPAKRQSEEMILQGRADKAPKVDSGVWAVGSKWMEGWKSG